MKTKYIFTLLFLPFFAACSQSDIPGISESENNTIHFGVYTGSQTRGKEVKLADVKGSGFGIIAQLTQGNYDATTAKSMYMDNQQVTWESSTSQWTYSPRKYWPTNGTDKLSFFAYSPYTASNTNGITLINESNKAAQLKLKLKENQKEMLDLVVAANKDLDGSSSDPEVTLNFRHVLAGVKMLAKPSTDLTSAGNEMQVYLTGVKLKQTGKLASEGTLSMATFVWTPQTYYTGNYDLGDATNGILNLTSTYDNKPALPLLDDKTAVSLFADGQALYFIPINGTTGCGEGDVQAELSYTYVMPSVTDPDTGSTPYVSSGTKSVDLPAGGFKQGTMCTYTFSIGVNDISVEPEINDYITISKETDNYNMLITCATDFVKFRNIVNGIDGETQNTSLNAIQTADIDLSMLPAGSTDIENWKPINAFDGIYNGNGYHIYNVKITNSITNAALFASTNANSILTDIHLINVNINSGYGSTGALVGTAQGVISRCSVENGSIIGIANNAGGLIGNVASGASVALCKADVSLDMSHPKVTTQYIGGFAGVNSSTIIACSASGTALVTSTEDFKSGDYRRTGGFVGQNNSDIYGSYAVGAATSKVGRNTFVGGFIGMGSGASSKIIGCYSKGKALIQGVASGVQAGGFIGGLGISGSYVNCFSTGGAQNSAASDDWGDFGSRNSGGAIFSNCHTTGSRAGQSRYGSWAGISTKANANNIRNIVRTVHNGSINTVKIAVNDPISTLPTLKDITWNAETFWSKTEGTNDNPDINWDAVK